MHQTGVRMTNVVIRSNEVVHASKVDVFDFEEQGGFFVPQDPFTVMPGDAFRTSCYYRDGGSFGLSSQEEMCIAYILYYPAISNFGFTWGCPYGLGTPICNQELESMDLDSETDLDRVFGSSGGVCPAASPSPSEQTTDNPSAGPKFDPTLSPTETSDGSFPTVSPAQMPVSSSPPPPTSLPKDGQEISSPPNEESSPTALPTQMPVSGSPPPTLLPTEMPTQVDEDNTPTPSSPEPPTSGKYIKRDYIMLILGNKSHTDF